MTNTIQKTIFSLTLCAALFALCLSAEAQQPTKIPRIGYVSGGGDPKTLTGGIETFRQVLRELGYIEGKNIVVEYRYAEGGVDMFPALVAELVRLKVDVLVSPVTTAIRAAKESTKTIPIVMVIPSDPVATGLIDSLARPGGNITGVTRLTRDLSGKRLELLKDAIPDVTRVAVLLDANGEGPKISFKEYETTARALKIQIQSFGVRGPNPDLEGAFQAAVKARVPALITIHNSLIVRYPKRIADLAVKYRMPSMYEGSQYAESGGLMSYSANDADQYRRAAVFVDKILKGAKPADLPVEQPTKFEFVINLKTAKQIGLTIPPNVLVRADRVIK